MTLNQSSTGTNSSQECIEDDEKNCVNRDLRIDSAADIYSIGITILTLMLNENGDEVEQIYLGTEEDPSATAYVTDSCSQVRLVRGTRRCERWEGPRQRVVPVAPALLGGNVSFGKNAATIMIDV